jgi:hypothetical protein
LINSKSLISDDINSRIAAGNRRLYSLRQVFRSRDMSQSVKVKVCKTMMNPDAMFWNEICAVAEMGKRSMGAWEREIY